MTLTSTKHTVYGRQIAFAAAFLLPASKLLEAPSLLARYAAGDLLAPAILHFLLQGGFLCFFLFLLQKSKRSLAECIQQKWGKSASIFYTFFALYYLFAATLPLLDLEKFTYAAFSDTEPSIFVFAFFFFLSADLFLLSPRDVDVTVSSSPE